MSDSIVLWRMCVVWERARFVLLLAVTLLVTTFGLNIANIVETATLRTTSGVTFNDNDTETIPTYGETSVGLAAAIVSLAGNLCATALVGFKAWYVDA